MKRFACALFATVLLAGAAFGAGVRMGSLTQQNMTEEEFAAFVKSQEKSWFGWKILATSHSLDDTFKYYDSLMTMLMALGSGNIDEAALPEPVAEYVANTNPSFALSCALRSRPTHLAFGLRNDAESAKLLERINEALGAMKSDRTLSLLRAKYLNVPGTDQPAPVKFESFTGPDAKTIKVAVTGDLPPIDLIAADGAPAGFNTAVLSEIGRRLKVNIELVAIDSGARTAALVSERADVVFWYQVVEGAEKQADVPEGVMLSDSYYEWDKFMHLTHFQR